MNPLNADNSATRKDDRWGSPTDLVDKLSNEFAWGGFDWDFAAERKTSVTNNQRCARMVDTPHAYYGPDHAIPALRDALTQPWGLEQGGETPMVGYLNPPFSLLEAFVEKAATSTLYPSNLCVVAVLPAKVETKWWHQWVPYADEVRFLKGRLRYIDPLTGVKGESARFPSCVVVWDGRKPRLGTRFSNWDWRAQ